MRTSSTARSKILKDGESFPANSIMAVLTANLNCGTKFPLRATGPAAETAVQRLRDLVAGFEADGF
jgi:phosphotransferase system HPr-like phosphotransfer protein